MIIEKNILYINFDIEEIYISNFFTSNEEKKIRTANLKENYHYIELIYHL